MTHRRRMPCSRTIAGVVGTVAESVVHIKVREGLTGRTNKGQETIQGSGSGFIISTDGFLVTNHHVIENAVSI
jgi:S1-C subfamily serine protease